MKCCDCPAELPPNSRASRKRCDVCRDKRQAAKKAEWQANNRAKQREYNAAFRERHKAKASASHNSYRAEKRRNVKVLDKALEIVVQSDTISFEDALKQVGRPDLIDWAHRYLESEAA